MNFVSAQDSFGLVGLQTPSARALIVSPPQSQSTKTPTVRNVILQVHLSE